MSPSVPVLSLGCPTLSQSCPHTVPKLSPQCPCTSCPYGIPTLSQCSPYAIPKMCQQCQWCPKLSLYCPMLSPHSPYTVPIMSLPSCHMDLTTHCHINQPIKLIIIILITIYYWLGLEEEFSPISSDKTEHKLSLCVIQGTTCKTMMNPQAVPCVFKATYFIWL